MNTFSVIRSKSYCVLVSGSVSIHQNGCRTQYRERCQPINNAIFFELFIFFFSFPEGWRESMLGAPRRLLVTLGSLSRDSSSCPATVSRHFVPYPLSTNSFLSRFRLFSWNKKQPMTRNTFDSLTKNN